MAGTDETGGWLEPEERRYAIFRRGYLRWLPLALPALVVLAGLYAVLGNGQPPIYLVFVGLLAGGTVALFWLAQRLESTLAIDTLWRRGTKLGGTLLAFYGQGKPFEFDLGDVGSWSWSQSNLAADIATSIVSYRPRRTTIRFMVGERRYQMTVTASDSLDLDQLQKVAPSLVAAIRQRMPGFRSTDLTFGTHSD